jgi:hypothetical protein
LYAQQRYAEALPIAEKALRDAERDFGPADFRVAISLESLAYLHVGQNDFAVGEPLAQRALTILQTAPSPDPRMVAFAFSTLSQIYQHEQCLAEAESFALRALEIQQKALPPNDPDLGFTLAVARSHFWETLGFNLVFGALAGWLLCFTAPVPQGEPNLTARSVAPKL